MMFETEVWTPKMLQRLEAIEQKLDEVRAFILRHERVLDKLEKLETRLQTAERQLENVRVRVWAVGVTAGAVVATIDVMLRLLMT